MVLREVLEHLPGYGQYNQIGYPGIPEYMPYRILKHTLGSATARNSRIYGAVCIENGLQSPPRWCSALRRAVRGVLEVPGRRYWIREIVGKGKQSACNRIHSYMYMRTRQCLGLIQGCKNKYGRFRHISSGTRFIPQAHVWFLWSTRAVVTSDWEHVSSCLQRTDSNRPPYARRLI